MQTTYKNDIVSIKHNRVIIVEFDNKGIYLHVTNKNDYMAEVFNKIAKKFQLGFRISKTWKVYHRGIVYQFKDNLVLK